MEEGLTSTERWSRRLAAPWVFWPLALAGFALVATAVLGYEAGRRLPLEGQVAAMAAEVELLEATRARLEAARDALRWDPAYTEQVVRRELNVHRPGEIPLPQPVDLAAGRIPEVGPTEPDVEPLLVDLAAWAPPERRFPALLLGAILLGAAVILSLPGRLVRG